MTAINFPNATIVTFFGRLLLLLFVPSMILNISLDVEASELEVTPPSFEGKVMIRLPDGRWVDRPKTVFRYRHPDIPPAGADIFLADGSENALAINIANDDNLVAVLNQGYSNTASMLTSADGNVNWTARTFPNGAGTYTGSPYDPWANHGNSADELFATLIRRDTNSSNSHVVIARSTDAGATWVLFYEQMSDVFQDREMVDVDRTTALGGGAGTAHDGKVYMCYDDFGPNKSGYEASYLQIISSTGTALIEIAISTDVDFNGGKLQPIAGTEDGQVYLMGLGSTGNGANRVLSFHEVTGAGASTSLNKSSMTFPTTGQSLGGGTRYGVNGHRINSHMAMDIDLTSGPNRGTLYVISNRNPNPADATQDQGDVFLSISTDGASSWNSAEIVGPAAGKTQFFSMLDVDENGWIHVAYYQNETGSIDNGVLNASSANLYYTVSKDGGQGWAPPEQVNDAANTLDYEDPPPDLSAVSYYLIGDYCQVKATGTGANTEAYVFWTGYDKDRGDTMLNDKRERVLCTTVVPNPNVPPVADAGPNQTVECTGPMGTPVMLDGTGSSDPDADPLSYMWSGVPFDDPTSPTPTGTFPLGTTTVTLTVTDGMFFDTDEVDITVEDTTRPDIMVELNRDVLWPPNHKLVDIWATVSVTDVCDDSPTFVLMSITSNEPDNGNGDGNTTNDIQDADFGTPDEHFKLRAERRGNGDGRKYTIVYQASDASGNTEDDTVCVRVPHDQSGNALASVGFVPDGTAFDPSFEWFAVAIPSRPPIYDQNGSGGLVVVEEGMDATELNVHHVYVGNTNGVVRPVQSAVIDVNGNGLSDLVLYYDIGEAQALQSSPEVERPNDWAVHRDESGGAIGLHYQASSGRDYLVSNIFMLGSVVPLLPENSPLLDNGDPNDVTVPGLSAIYPNPFNPVTTVGFYLDRSQHVTLRIYDARGARVRNLRNEVLAAGEYRVEWNGKDDRGRPVATGVYFARMVFGEQQSTRKMLLLK
jgi:hypothetical protein